MSVRLIFIQTGCLNLPPGLSLHYCCDVICEYKNINRFISCSVGLIYFQALISLHGEEKVEKRTLQMHTVPTLGPT
jgi:hypothetical protein